MAGPKTTAITRREAGLGLVVLGAALTTSACATAQTAAPLGWTPKALSLKQARVLDTVAELIVPPTDTPGAREAGVPQFVDRAVGDYCTQADAQAIRAGLDRMDVDARGVHGAGFVSLRPEQQIALLTRYDAEASRPDASAPGAPRDIETGLTARSSGAAATPVNPRFFSVLKDLVTVGYFTSRLGATKAVIYVPVPGAYRACVPLREIGRSWEM